MMYVEIWDGDRLMCRDKKNYRSKCEGVVDNTFNRRSFYCGMGFCCHHLPFFPKNQLFLLSCWVNSLPMFTKRASKSLAFRVSARASRRSRLSSVTTLCLLLLVVTSPVTNADSVTTKKPHLSGVRDVPQSPTPPTQSVVQRNDERQFTTRQLTDAPQESGAANPPTVVPVTTPMPVSTPMPASTPMPSSTPIPSSIPTPVISMAPTGSPSETPTMMPSTVPTLKESMGPSSQPTTSQNPSGNPTSPPTSSLNPSAQPSEIPSDAPSDMPSMVPTAEATFSPPIRGEARFRQKLAVANGRIFTSDEVGLIQGLYRSYTINFAEPLDIIEGRIETACVVTTQTPTARRQLREHNPENLEDRALQGILAVDLDFTMTYTSIYTNVTGFPVFFQGYVNSNLETVASQMRLLALNVSSAENVIRIVIIPQPTPLPSVSPSPSSVPSTAPSDPSASPSSIPSDFPSLAPTSAPSPLPSVSPTRTVRPVETPTASPGRTTSAPSLRPSENVDPDTDGVKQNTVIVVSVVVAGSIMLIGLLIYYRKRKRLQELAYQSNATEGKKRSGYDRDLGDSNRKDAELGISLAGDNLTPLSPFQKADHSGNQGRTPTAAEGVLSPSESLVSNQSLLSAGMSMGGDSGDEADATQGLADEFDQYKDQNLEKMRADVEGSITGFGGMMSQALTRALLDDDEADFDAAELAWGGSGNLTGPEIEASALGEVMDWLKRKDTPSLEEKRDFMQATLNKMVSSVRHGILGPDDASRSIHECAALLGLQLATEIPVVTLIITGMRKTVAAEDMIAAFSEFGDISDAAVSSNQRGFGILRFKSNQSVDRAMKKFRSEEIVVQDVAVQVRVLRPGSAYTGTTEKGAAGKSNTSSKK